MSYILKHFTAYKILRHVIDLGDNQLYPPHTWPMDTKNHPFSMKCPQAIWPLLWTSRINYLLLFRHLITFFCIMTINVHLLCFLLDHNLLRLTMVSYSLCFIARSKKHFVYSKHSVNIWMNVWMNEKERRREGRRKQEEEMGRKEGT